MAIKLTQTEKFTVKKIVIEVANDKGGWDKNTMDATFRRATTEEGKELSALKDPKEVVLRQMTGWAGVLDDDGNEVDFTPEHLAALLLLPAAVVAVGQAFWDHQFKARTGN